MPVRVLRDGIKVDEEYTLVSNNNSIVEVNGNKLIGRGLGTATVTATLNRNKTIAVDIEIIVSEQHDVQTSQLFIEGSDYIEWNSGEDGENDYFFSTREPGQFTYEVQSKIRVTSEDIKNDNDEIIGIRLIVKDKYAGKIKIKGITETQEVEKIVYIRTV